MPVFPPVEADQLPPGGETEDHEEIRLFGWQAGKDGFVRTGMGAPYYPDREWSDYLYQGLFAGQDSGKSYSGAVRHLLYIQAWPGSVNIIAAPDFTRLERATLQTWKEVLASQGLLEGVHWFHNITLKKITYWNGAVDFLCSMDNPNSVRGIRAASIWLDEAGYCDFASMKALQPRMTRPGFPHFFDMTSTPVGRTHWSYSFFFPRRAFQENYSQVDLDLTDSIIEEAGNPAVDRKCVTRLRARSGLSGGTRICTFAATRENPHGGEEEAEELALLFGANSPEYMQEEEGRFTVPGGLTYSSWQTATHALSRATWPDPGTNTPTWKPDRVAMGGDFGVFPGKAAWVVWGVGLNGREYQLDEWGKNFSGPEEMAAEGARLAKKWGVTHVVTDHDPTWFRIIRAELLRIHVPMYRANKMVGTRTDPSGGIGMISALLTKRFPDGSPGFILDRDQCPQTIREYENYQRPELKEGRLGTEAPLKKDDHFMDAARYVRTFIALRLHWTDTEKRARGLTVLKAQYAGMGAA